MGGKGAGNRVGRVALNGVTYPLGPGAARGISSVLCVKFKYHRFFSTIGFLSVVTDLAFYIFFFLGWPRPDPL